MKTGYFIIIAILMFGLVLSVNATDVNDNPVEGLNTNNDIKQAVDDAKLQDKNVMVIFDQKNCVWCDILKSETLNNSQVKEKLNQKYICVFVDINKNPQLASDYSVHGTPLMIFLNKDSDELSRIEGYVTADELLNKLEEI